MMIFQLPPRPQVIQPNKQATYLSKSLPDMERNPGQVELKIARPRDGCMCSSSFFWTRYKSWSDWYVNSCSYYTVKLSVDVEKSKEDIDWSKKKIGAGCRFQTSSHINCKFHKKESRFQKENLRKKHTKGKKKGFREGDDTTLLYVWDRW